MTIEVTQADRDAAANLARVMFQVSAGVMAEYLNGHRDQEEFVQAFARHRQSAERGEVVAWMYEKNGKVLLDHGPTCSDDMVSGGWAASPLYTLPTPPEAA